MPAEQQTFGQTSEALAVMFLEQQGYTILEQNYRNRVGEIDIIAREQNTLAFIEVKSRRSGGAAAPRWAVTRAKQRKISMVALTYLKATRQFGRKARFDVLTIHLGFDPPQFDLIRNAFELAYGR